MLSLSNPKEIILYAIRREADAAAFYRMAEERSNPGVKKAFEELAIEEESHKRKLETLNLEKIEIIESKGPKGLGLSELLKDSPFSIDMSYEELLRMAIKKEESSEKLYISLSQLVKDEKVKKILLVLAQEESSHKEKLEKIYDTEILQEF